MRITTGGIVLHTISFSESALVVHMYTRLYGTQSYLVNKVRSKKASHQLSFFQPLTVVEIEAYHKPHVGLQKITKIQPELSFQSGNYSPVKSALAFFLAEILHKSLRESESHEEVFEFLHTNIQKLHLQADSACANFHLFFLLGLSRFLGFAPQPRENGPDSSLFFDLKEGFFVEKTPLHQHYISGNQAVLFSRLLLNDPEQVPISRSDRKDLLNSLVAYYSLHIPGMGKVKSLAVLEELFE